MDPGRGRADHRLPRRIRRPARSLAGPLARANAARRQRPRSRLRPQLAGNGRARLGQRAESLAGAHRPSRNRALLRLPGGRDGRGQELHGEGRRVRRPRHRALLASRLHEHAHRCQQPRLRQREVPLPGPHRARRRQPGNRPFRARRRGIDEHRRELPAGAHGRLRPPALRDHQWWRRAQCGARRRRGLVFHSLARTPSGQRPHRAGPQDRGRGGDDDRNHRRGNLHLRHLQPAAQQCAHRRDDAGTGRPRPD